MPEFYTFSTFAFVYPLYVAFKDTKIFIIVRYFKPKYQTVFD